MSVPIDDHGFHRGHCVFDTANVAGGKAFGLSMHLDRLLGSAQQARIDTSALEKDTLKRIILETIGATERRDGVFVRYWPTAGRGDFGISPKNCVEPSFYCVVHDDSHGGNDRGLSAAPVDVPLKPPLLATAKTNNYMINALVAMEAEAKARSSASSSRPTATSPSRRSRRLPSSARTEFSSRRPPTPSRRRRRGAGARAGAVARRRRRAARLRGAPREARRAERRR